LFFFFSLFLLAVFLRGWWSSATHLKGRCCSLPTISPFDARHLLFTRVYVARPEAFSCMAYFGLKPCESGRHTVWLPGRSAERGLDFPISFWPFYCLRTPGKNLVAVYFGIPPMPPSGSSQPTQKNSVSPGAFDPSPMLPLIPHFRTPPPRLLLRRKPPRCPLSFLYDCATALTRRGPTPSPGPPPFFPVRGCGFANHAGRLRRTFRELQS